MRRCVIVDGLNDSTLVFNVASAPADEVIALLGPLHPLY